MSYILYLLGIPNLTTVAVFLLVLLMAIQLGRQPSKLPPGPPKWPIIGNLLLLLNKDKRAVFRSLHARYGDLVSLRVGRQSIIVVSGLDTLRQVFVDRGKDFGARPPVFTTLKVGQGKAVVNSSGETWREHRAFMMSNLGDLGVGKTKFQENVLDEVKSFLQVLEDTHGEDFDPRYAVQTATSNVICAISFGRRFDYDDADFKKMLKIFEDNMRCAGSTAIVNYFPFLEKMPGDYFKCRELLDNVDKIQTILKRWIDIQVKTPDPEKKQNIIERYIREMNDKRMSLQETTMDESQLLKFVGDLFVGGTETTATTIRWGLVFLVRNPDIQRRVRAEILATLGGRTHLSVEDRANMPYTSATIYETQRLGDIAPFALPHCNFQSVILDKYVIPAGSVVIPNLNSVHHDPAIFPDPEEFRPERFLDSDGKAVSRKELMPFCIGNRMCPGRTLGTMETFLFLTSILHHFEVLPARSGRLPVLDGDVGITYVPYPHEMRFVRRDTRV